MDPAPHRAADREDDAWAGLVRTRWRGAVLDIAPVFCFTVGFAGTGRLALAWGLALAVGVGVCGYRLVRRRPVWSALGVVGLVCLDGALTMVTGNATSFFLPGLLLQAVMIVVTPVLLALGWPPMGLVVGLVTGERNAWRRCPVRRRAFVVGNLVILAGTVLKMVLELPLFLLGRTVALGSVHLLAPGVLAASLLLGWRVYRRHVGTHRCSDHRDTAPPSRREHRRLPTVPGEPR